MKEGSWLHKYKRLMRKNPTKAELVFKTALQESGFKFRHQSGCYSKEFQCIVDFLIKSDGIKLAIEIDGKYHNGEQQKKKDSIRTKWLKDKRGYMMIRFTNEDVFADVKKCLRDLSVFYINCVKASQSKNFNACCRLLNLNEQYPKIITLQSSANNKKVTELATTNWGESEPLF